MMGFGIAKVCQVVRASIRMVSGILVAEDFINKNIKSEQEVSDFGFERQVDTQTLASFSLCR